jgi:hypothetical protein
MEQRPGSISGGSASADIDRGILGDGNADDDNDDDEKDEGDTNQLSLVQDPGR